jgi:hypothetical protein
MVAFFGDACEPPIRYGNQDLAEDHPKKNQLDTDVNECVLHHC